MGKPIPADSLHRILRETLRNYLTLQALVSQHGNFEIEHKGVRLSYLDLQGALASLSPRKREAVMLNVVFDKKQKDVAEIMGITTVSVGQYVESGMIQLAKHYFAERDHIDPKPTGKE